MKEQLTESISDPKVLTIVEWSNIVGDVLPNERITIELKPTANDPDERVIEISYPEELSNTIRRLEELLGRSES